MSGHDWTKDFDGQVSCRRCRARPGDLRSCWRVLLSDLFVDLWDLSGYWCALLTIPVVGLWRWLVRCFRRLWLILAATPFADWLRLAWAMAFPLLGAIGGALLANCIPHIAFLFIILPFAIGLAL